MARSRKQLRWFLRQVFFKKPLTRIKLRDINHDVNFSSRKHCLQQANLESPHWGFRLSLPISFFQDCFRWCFQSRVWELSLQVSREIPLNYSCFNELSTHP